MDEIWKWGDSDVFLLSSTDLVKIYHPKITDELLGEYHKIHSLFASIGKQTAPISVRIGDILAHAISWSVLDLSSSGDSIVPFSGINPRHTDGAKSLHWAWWRRVYEGVVSYPPYIRGGILEYDRERTNLCDLDYGASEIIRTVLLEELARYMDYKLAGYSLHASNVKLVSLENGVLDMVITDLGAWITILVDKFDASDFVERTKTGAVKILDRVTG